MSTALYSHTTRVTGTVLTAAIYNADHQNHITNGNPSQHGAYSDNLSQYQLITDPGGLGTESLAPNLAGELERIRFAIKRITGKAQWYIAPATDLQSVGGTITDLVVTQTAAFQGDNSPAQITSNQNNYAPASHATAFRFRLSTDAARDVTGLAGGANGRVVVITNIGSNPLRLTNEDAASTAANRFALGSNTTISPSQSLALEYDNTSSRWRPFSTASSSAGGVAAAFEAGGRVTLATGLAVMTATVSGATSHFYTPYKHRFVPIYDGVSMTMQDVLGELTQTAADTTKSPAATANNSVYYLWVWNDSGTFRCTRGTAWTNDTTPGANNALTLQNGVYLNTNAITNGPGALRGTLVGAIRSNGTATFDWVIGGLAAGGTAIKFDVSNIYNRVLCGGFVGDTTDNWSYTTKTWRSANASATMRASFLQALQQDSFFVQYGVVAKGNVGSIGCLPAASAAPYAGIGYDATNALAAGCASAWGIGTTALDAATGNPAYVTAVYPLRAMFSKLNDLGYHFAQAIEAGLAGGGGSTVTWYGDNADPSFSQNGLHYWGMH